MTNSHVELEDLQLSQAEFDALPNYSHSLPTGKTIGKTWKAMSKSDWFQGEYVDDPDPEMVGIKWRRIKIVENASSTGGSMLEETSLKIAERLANEFRSHCPQCNAAVGEEHDWCGIALCRSTGAQLIQCEGELHEYKGREYGEHEGECGPDKWTGYWPGTKEAIERGWFTKFSPVTITKWQDTTIDDPEGLPNLERVVIDLVWSPELQQCVEPPTDGA